MAPKLKITIGILLVIFSIAYFCIMAIVGNEIWESPWPLALLIAFTWSTSTSGTYLVCIGFNELWEKTLNQSEPAAL